MDENTKIQINQAIIDCHYVAQLIISELPDMPKIELLEDVIKTSLAFKFCQECEKKESILYIQEHLRHFKSTLYISEYDRKEFLKDIILDVLGEEWR